MTDHKDIVERVVGEMRASSWSCGPRCESMSTLQDDADFQRWADLIEAQASRIVELEGEREMVRGHLASILNLSLRRSPGYHYRTGFKFMDMRNRLRDVFKHAEAALTAIQETK